MSKVQVDTIVDKDDISAPTLSKGAIVTGVCTATTFVGAVTGDVTGNADTATSATSATTAITATNAQGLTGTPNISCGTIAGSTGTFTGDVDIADKIVHTGDTDTAIRFPDANIFSVETGGTERLRIIADGKVGIGTTIPTRSFDVRGDATIGIDQHSGNPGTTVGILTVRGHHVNSDSEYAQLYLANSNSSGGSTASIRGNRESSNNATSLSFFTNHTAAAGNGEERLRIGTIGQLGLSAGGVGTAATDYGTSGQVLTSGGASATATWATPSGGLSEYDQWQCTDNTQSNEAVWAFDVIGSSNPSGGPVTLARVTTSQNPRFVKIGTGMSYSAGIWTFPSTGYWEVIMSAQLYTTSNATRNFRLETTENNSTYTETCRAQMYGSTYSSHTHNWINYFNITDVSNQKIRYLLDSSGSSCAWYGANNMTRTNWIFKKVG